MSLNHANFTVYRGMRSCYGERAKCIDHSLSHFPRTPGQLFALLTFEFFVPSFGLNSFEIVKLGWEGGALSGVVQADIL